MNEVVEETKMWLEKDASLVTIEEEGDYIIIRPKHYLPTDVWGRINQTLGDHGGEYVSAGKESHWKRRKNTPPVGNPNVRKACDLLEKALIILKEEGYT